MLTKPTYLTTCFAYPTPAKSLHSFVKPWLLVEIVAPHSKHALRPACIKQHADVRVCMHRFMHFCFYLPLCMGIDAYMYASVLL